MDIILTAIIALPMVFVLSLYLMDEEGPFNVFWGIRKLAGFTREEILDIAGNKAVKEVAGTGFWGQVLSCHRCLSPYVTAVIILFLGLINVSEWNTLMIVTWFTVTGLNVLVFEALGR